MTSSRELDTIAQRCRQNDIAEFSPNFGSPSPLVFGGGGSLGTPGIDARADHIHAVPKIPSVYQNLNLEGFFVHDHHFANGGSINARYTAFGLAVGALSDGTVDISDAPGNLGIYVAVIGAGGACILSDDSLSGNTTRRRQSPQSIVSYETRLRVANTAAPHTLTSTPGGFIFCFGTARTSTTLDMATITDGIFFRLALVGNSATIPIEAVCVADSVETAVDTGVIVALSGSIPPITGLYQTYRIQYDGTAVTFFLDGLLVATITENIPTALTYGFGWYLDDRGANASPQGVIVDYIDLRFRRTL